MQLLKGFPEIGVEQQLRFPAADPEDSPPSPRADGWFRQAQQGRGYRQPHPWGGSKPVVRHRGHGLSSFVVGGQGTGARVLCTDGEAVGGLRELL